MKVCDVCRAEEDVKPRKVEICDSCFEDLAGGSLKKPQKKKRKGFRINTDALGNFLSDKPTQKW